MLEGTSRGGSNFEVEVEAYKTEEGGGYKAVWGSVGRTRDALPKPGKDASAPTHLR